MKSIKRFLLIAFLLLVALAVAVAFLSAPFGRRYVNEHGEELIGRRVNIEDFTFNIFTGGVSLDDVTVYEKNGDSVFASVEDVDLDLSMLDLLKGKITIEELEICDPTVNVVQKDTVFNFDDMLASLSEGESSEYTIEDFTLKGGEINYLDLTVPSVPFKYSLHKFRVEAENFTTSGRNQIDISARLGEDGKIKAKFDGMISDQNNMTLVLNMKNVDLTDFTPLFIQMFGREVKSGTLDLDTEMSIINGHINGTNHIVIDEPKVEKVKGLDFKPEYRKIPLKSALYVMTDKHGKCEMDLTVTGDKSDPKFSYKRALMKMFGKFVVKLVTSPFSHIGSNDE